MKINLKIAFIIILFVASFSLTSFAQKTVVVKFAKGKSSAVINDVIHGYEYKDFVFTAKSGQNLAVSVNTKTYATVFDVFKKKGNFGESDNDTGETVNLTIPSDGKYVVRVRMMRSQARRKNSVAKFSVNISIK